MHFAFSRSVRSGDPTSSPKVSLNPVSRGPRHWAYDVAATFGVPKAVSVCLMKVLVRGKPVGAVLVSLPFYSKDKPRG